MIEVRGMSYALCVCLVYLNCGCVYSAIWMSQQSLPPDRSVKEVTTLRIFSDILNALPSTK